MDDEEIVLVALRETLRQQGFHVTTAPNAVEGMTQLPRHRYALVITDHQMPRLTGLEFLAHVRQSQPDASRLLITAVLNIATVIDAINKAEIFRFLLKPWRREDLLDAVRTGIERHEGIVREHELLAAAMTENQSLHERVQELEDRLSHNRLKPVLAK